MTETLSLMLALVTGISLGAIFFGGLWWTVQKGVSSNQPALWFLGSLLLRTWLALAGFYFVARGQLGAAAGLPRWICRGPPYRNAVHPPGGQPCTLVPIKPSSGNTGFSNSMPP